MGNVLKSSILMIFLSSCVATDLTTVAAKKPANSKFETNTTKLNSGNEIFRAPTSSSDCGYYLVGLGGWKITSFKVNDKIYMNVPCKTSDAGSDGWHYGMMYWGVGNLTTTWIDGNLGAAGEQPIVSKQETDVNGFIVDSLKTMEVTFNGSSYSGLVQKYYSAANYGGSNGYYWSPVNFSSPENFAATDIDVDNRAVIEDTASDSTWKGKTLSEIDIEYKDGTYYVYKTNINHPSNDTYYIVLNKTTDLINYDSPSSYLIKDYRDPHVFKHSDKIYMIAYNTLSNNWQLIPGDSYESFDTENAVTLSIGNKMYGKGSWDDTPYYTDFQNSEPNLAGVEVINSKIYLLYLAGGFSQLSGDANSSSPYHGVPYDAPRGIGVMELEID